MHILPGRAGIRQRNEGTHPLGRLFVARSCRKARTSESAIADQGAPIDRKLSEKLDSSIHWPSVEREGENVDTRDGTRTDVMTVGYGHSIAIPRSWLGDSLDDGGICGLHFAQVIEIIGRQRPPVISEDTSYKSLAA